MYSKTISNTQNAEHVGQFKGGALCNHILVVEEKYVKMLGGF